MTDQEKNILNIAIDIEKIKNNISQYTAQKLCDMIVCGQYFGINQDIVIICMEELSKRRAAGEQFDFESYIKSSTKELPELNFSSSSIDFRSILQQATKNLK